MVTVKFKVSVQIYARCQVLKKNETSYCFAQKSSKIYFLRGKIYPVTEFMRNNFL